MRLFVLLLLLPLSALAQSPLETVEQKLIVNQKQMWQALDGIDELLPSADNPAVARMIAERVVELRVLQEREIELTQLLSAFARQQPAIVVEQPPPVVVVEQPPIVDVPVVVQPVGPEPVTSSDLARIRNAMSEEPFGKGKREVLRSASRDRFFLVDQVISLMDQFSFDEDKVETAAMLHDRVLDRENWYLIYPELTFSSSRDDLKRRVGDR